jgi:hypothetical protein
MEYDNNHFIIASWAYSLQNVRGYGWLSPNCSDMRDGGSLGEQLLPSSVPLLGASFIRLIYQAHTCTGGLLKSCFWSHTQITRRTTF